MGWLLSHIDNSVSMPLFGVPLTVLGMAAGGAFASFAYGQPEKSRLKLFGMAIANTFLGALSVALLPVWLDWTWVTPMLQPPLAGFLAFIARWVIPLVIELAPQWVRNWISSLANRNVQPPGDSP